MEGTGLVIGDVSGGEGAGEALVVDVGKVEERAKRSWTGWIWNTARNKGVSGSSSSSSDVTARLLD